MTDMTDIQEVSEAVFERCPTGIRGLDEITNGGLPKGRTTLVSGSAGCGKTVMATEFLVRGARSFDEPGVLASFEETKEDLQANFASFGFGLGELIADRKLIIDHVHIERAEIEESGAYDLSGLFIRLGHAIESIGAKRVVLDTLEALFEGFSNRMILRAELRRLFRRLKEWGVTSIVTGESGGGSLTRYGLEEFVADCVIVLDHRVLDQVATRRLRIVKYRGGVHGADEHPFLIGESGVSVIPVTSVGLDAAASDERISTGVEGLDRMLDGRGYYRASSVLISGSAGTGKTSFGAHFVVAACRRGERAIYFAFEESRDQIVRNMGSIGLDLAKWEERGLLRFHAVRPTLLGLEGHLAGIYALVDEFKPSVVVMDPISNFSTVGSFSQSQIMLTRLVDRLKRAGVTALFTDLVPGIDLRPHEDLGVSSVMDTWIVVRNAEIDGKRNRTVSVLKSRGMDHSNEAKPISITRDGLRI